MIGNLAYGVIKGISQAIEVIRGTSPGGNTVNTLILDANASSVNGTYDPAIVIIYEGTGKGQARQVWDYVGASKTCILNRDWKFIPDETSKYKILFQPGDTHVNEGMAQGGGANTITLNSLANDQNNMYLGQIVFITSGTGQDQARMVVGYNGTTKVATVDSNWVVQPDSTSVYAIYPFPGFVHGRPNQNSSENVLMRDVVGNKTDLVQVPYTSGIQSIMAHLNTAYYHAHGASFVYPDIANAVVLTAGAGAWNQTGAITEIIPANGITKAFDIHWAFITAISENAEIQVNLYSGAIGEEVLIGPVPAERTAVQSQAGSIREQIPQQPANTRISARLYSSVAGATTAKIKLMGHVYSGSLT